MKRFMFLFVAVASVLAAAAARAQDPVKVESIHYSVILENDAVRVLRIHYAPGEKSVMHHHPASVAVFLHDQKAKFTYPDGKTEEVSVKAGDVNMSPAGEHLPEDIGDTPIDVILVELKTKPAMP